MGKYPVERETNSAAGLAKRAAMSRATDHVYWVPEYFWCESNMATSKLSVPKREESGLRLSAGDLQVGGNAQVTLV
jgi:hypothetical protein